MQLGTIITSIADLRRDPDEKSERVNQALYGTPVEIHDNSSHWRLIQLPDRYRGWTRCDHIHELSPAAWRTYVNRPKNRVKAEQIHIYDDSRQPVAPYRLYFGSQLVVGKKNDACRMQLPGRPAHKIALTALAEPVIRRSTPATRRAIIGTAKRFLGVPYLWGGISIPGIDCSGLVQTVFAFYGISLPRDSSTQKMIGMPIERWQLQPADLLFFPGHVAIFLGEDSIIHASAQRGMVVIESLNPESEVYREDLDRSFDGARRHL